MKKITNGILGHIAETNNLTESDLDDFLKNEVFSKRYTGNDPKIINRQNFIDMGLGDSKKFDELRHMQDLDTILYSYDISPSGSLFGIELKKIVADNYGKGDIIGVVIDHPQSYKVFCDMLNIRNRELYSMQDGWRIVFFDPAEYTRAIATNFSAMAFLLPDGKDNRLTIGRFSQRIRRGDKRKQIICHYPNSEYSHREKE